jgi:two-component system, cell cycle response regulator
VKLLRAVLAAEYLDVITAGDGPQALIRAAEIAPDAVLLDGMMPGMSGFEVCRRIKSAPGTSHVPVLIVTTLDRPADRVAALEAGADDLVTKPIDRTLLLARVRNLVRAKSLLDVLRMRGDAAHARRAGDPTLLEMPPDEARLLLIEDQREASEPIRLALGARHRVHVERDAEDALLLAQRAEFDAIAVDLSLGGADGLRVCARLRALEATRHVPMLVIARDWSSDARVRALDLGVNGFVSLPLHPGELVARVGSLVRRKRYWDQLSARAPLATEHAASELLAGPPDRRQLERHLAPLVAKNVARGRPVSLLLIDVDPLEPVNDAVDSEVGDEVLREVARRIAAGLRDLDLACRFGGEEFVAAFPGVDAAGALRIGERLRQRITDEPFPIATEAGPLRVTISIGLATTSGSDDTADALLARADGALHRAKKEGRNRVVACA